MNTRTGNVYSNQASIQTRIAELSNQTTQLTHTVFNRYLHRTSARISVGVHTGIRGCVPVESATTGTQTTFFFAPEASSVNANIFYAGTWFFIQNQVWCLLEDLISSQMQDMHAFTSALGGMVNGVKCIGLARRLCNKHASHGSNDTHISSVMISGGDIIILPPVHTSINKPK
jgi:hypothetical protein